VPRHQRVAVVSDIHRKTAAEMFGVPEDEVTPEQRRAAKNRNFPLLYGSDIGGLKPGQLHVISARTTGPKTALKFLDEPDDYGRPLHGDEE